MFNCMQWKLDHTEDTASTFWSEAWTVIIRYLTPNVLNETIIDQEFTAQCLSVYVKERVYCYRIQCNSYSIGLWHELRTFKMYVYELRIKKILIVQNVRRKVFPV